MNYGGGGSFFPFGIIFILLYAFVVIYFLVQLTGIHKALHRIAGILEKRSPEHTESKPDK